MDPFRSIIDSSCTRGIQQEGSYVHLVFSQAFCLSFFWELRAEGPPPILTIHKGRPPPPEILNGGIVSNPNQQRWALCTVNALIRLLCCSDA